MPVCYAVCAIVKRVHTLPGGHGGLRSRWFPILLLSGAFSITRSRYYRGPFQKRKFRYDKAVYYVAVAAAAAAAAAKDVAAADNVAAAAATTADNAASNAGPSANALANACAVVAMPVLALLLLLLMMFPLRQIELGASRLKKKCKGLAQANPGMIFVR